MTDRIVEVVNSKGCSRLFHGFSSAISSFSSFKFSTLMPPASSSILEPMTAGPFAGLVICVTRLSKETRMQVMAATERLGGRYSSSLHPQCTHLVVQSCSGRKFEHALKHGLRNGLLIVTLGWFVDSVRRNVRLSETLYSVKRSGESGMPLRNLNQLVGLSGAENSCLPHGVFENEKSLSTVWQNELKSSMKDLRSGGSILSCDCMYIDSGIPTEVKKKGKEIAEERQRLVDAAKLGVRTRRSRRMQENMSPGEVNLAIHPDSRHADRLRSLCASKESTDQGFVPFKRIEFLGSRRSFEELKRVSGGEQ